MNDGMKCIFFGILCLILLNPSIIDQALAEEKTVIEQGEPFPQIPLKTPADPGLREYLGLPEGETFTIKDIKADLVLVEVMNINCGSCQQQAPIYNKLFELIESSPETKGRVKMLSIAAGNLAKHIQQYVDHFKAPYPVIEDPKFVMYEAIGRGPTPLAIFVRSDNPEDAGLVVATHLGLRTKHEEMFKEMQDLLKLDLAAVQRKERDVEEVTGYVEPLLSGEALEDQIKGAFAKEVEPITGFEAVNLEKREVIYTALGKKDGKEIRLFARVVSRPPPCDLCHDIHFIYVFDGSGKILQFIPVQLTKYDNEDWDEADISKMRERVLGRYMFSPFDFDPEVDAVTSATITSAVIFKTLDDGKDIYRELKAKGLM